MNIRYAYGYVRVSTDKQEELSPDSQEKLLHAYASQNNITIKEIFFELGISGRKADKRPEFLRMIKMAKSREHPVDIILVWKFSRFARNQEESIVYKSLLKKQHNVNVISISEPLVEGPFGSLIERIIEWMDEYYSIRLSGEVLRGMTEKSQRGGYQTPPCLGYKAAGNGAPFLIDEDQYKIVDYIFQRYDKENADMTSIARELNALGHHTQRGKAFEQRGIERILKNPFYYGLVEWGGTSFTGDHEVRLTREQFNERLKKMERTCHPKNRRNVSTCSHWLSGLLKCGTCGASLVYNHREHSPGFQCYKYAKGLHPGSMSISERKVISAVYEYFETFLYGIDIKYQYVVPKMNAAELKQHHLNNELVKIYAKEERIRLAYENGIDTLEEYRTNKERLLKMRIQLEHLINELNLSIQNHRNTETDTLSDIKTIYDLIKNPLVDYTIKGTVMRNLFEDIVYDKKSESLIFHLYIS